MFDPWTSRFLLGPLYAHAIVRAFFRDLTVDLDMKRSLSKQGLTLSAVPSEGAVVRLKTVVNENCWADNATATHRLCPELIEAGARAAGAAGVRLAGVDVITVDPDLSLEESGGAIIEVNAPPTYYDAFPVAVHVLERLLLHAPEGSALEPWSTATAFAEDGP